MKKKSVNLITAVGVLVVLSGAYVGVKAYVAKQEAADTESAEGENPEIISIASADVKSIKFVIDKKEVTFEKDGDSWVKSDETGFPVDQDKIDTLVSSLNSIKAERTLENVEDASEYELDQPDNTITVTTEDGETTVIQLGMENDSTSQEYIDLNKDSSTVYVVSNSTFSSFEGTLYDFAKSGVFPTVDSSTVSKISVDGKDSSYVVEKDENNFWNITGDGETEKADSAKATSLASTLSSVLVECGKMLRRGTPKMKNGKPVRDKQGKVIYEPYRIKVLNTINFKKSMHYNPFRYIRSEKDILKLVNTIIANTKGEGEKSSEDFWVSATRSQAVKSLRTVLVY